MLFRLKAAGLHFLFCLVVALVSVVLVYGYWYPAPLSAMAGITGIFLILLSVDVVLGPLLTFIVGNEKKKSLKFDLSVIVFIQLGAFFYGMYTVFEGRPAWLVFVGDRFELVQAYEVDNKYLDNAQPEFSDISWRGPHWIGAKLPEDAKARDELLFSSVSESIDLPQRSDLYVSYSAVAADISQRAIPLSELISFNIPEVVKSELVKWPSADSYLPIYSGSKDSSMTVLLRRETAEVIAIVDLAPW
ncbi:TfpX/TfpZ family type IV pilin accessory protein [Cellvibrio polysaccharolyticus]|nr:TfpX/TfpZ family type IV pilin accessory protein [Cellvibrio polysaccharolyticus]